MYMQPRPQQTFTRWKCDFQEIFVEETQEKKKAKRDSIKSILSSHKQIFFPEWCIIQ